MTELQQRQLEQQIAESIALSAKLQAETAKINKEKDWYVAIVASTATLAIVALVKLFL